MCVCVFVDIYKMKRKRIRDLKCAKYFEFGPFYFILLYYYDDTSHEQT